MPESAPGAGKVPVRVRAVGVGGSDLHYHLEGGIGPARVEAPLTPGHELSAAFVEGTRSPYGLADGTQVAEDPAQNCGRCEPCMEGSPRRKSAV